MTLSREPNTWVILGLMSGSSLDGLDLCLVRFSRTKNSWQYQILAADTQPYPESLSSQIRQARQASALHLVETDTALAHFMAQAALDFCQKAGQVPQALASHGHTIFHNPAGGYTTQIGNGGLLHALTGWPVVCDFRTTDVGLGGQGAPLVPIGDALLFSHYRVCLNLGGIANLSYDSPQGRIAHDIGYANQGLNFLAQKRGHSYDPEGSIAQSGSLQPELLVRLNAFPWLSAQGARSLGYEDFDLYYTPILSEESVSLADRLHTFGIHIAQQIAQVLAQVPSPQGQILLTGGGAFNTWLVEQIRQQSPSWDFVVPDSLTVSSKEALIFAFLGLLRLLESPNSLASVTGARTDSIGGALYGVNPLQK